MNSKDWAAIYSPIIMEVAKLLFGLIFGKEAKKKRLINEYRLSPRRKEK